MFGPVIYVEIPTLQNVIKTHVGHVYSYYKLDQRYLSITYSLLLEENHGAIDSP